MRSAGTPCASSSSRASSLSAANHAERNSRRALTPPNGLRASRARSPQSPVPSTVTRQGRPSRRAAQGDRARRQGAVSVNEVDLRPAPEDVAECAGDVGDRGERRLPARRGVRWTTEPAIGSRHGLPSTARVRTSVRTPRSARWGGAARAAARLRRSTAGRTEWLAPRQAVDPGLPAVRSSGPTGSCDRPPRLRLRRALGLGAEATPPATWWASSPARREARPVSAIVRRASPATDGLWRSVERRPTTPSHIASESSNEISQPPPMLYDAAAGARAIAARVALTMSPT